MDLDLNSEEDAFVRHLRARGLSAATIKTYLKAIHHFQAYLSDREPTPAEIDSWVIAQQEAGLGEATVAQHFRSLQQFWKYVARENDITNPMTGKTPPKIHLRPPEVLAAEELILLFRTCQGPSFDDRRDLTILSLFADTGVRRSELAGVTLDDLDLREQVMVVTGKTGTRGVPYGAETATRLDRYLRVRRQHKHTALPWLWLGKRGRFTEFGIEGVVETRAREAGLKVHPHLFRHTFAHQWLDGGGNEGDLQRLMGWSSGQMLQRYGASAASARARRAYLAGRSPVDRIQNGLAREG